MNTGEISTVRALAGRRGLHRPTGLILYPISVPSACPPGFVGGTFQVQSAIIT